MKPKILVVGSMAMDLTVTSERFVGEGETIFGNGFSSAPGGKGANQAVQAARLGSDVTMLGKVGNDNFGNTLVNSLKQSGVNTEKILVSDSVSTGVAVIQIQKNESGTENKIIVIKGSNNEITVDDVAFLETEIINYDMVILQHEIPQEVNSRVAKFAKAKNIPVMLNPAPSAEVPEELISCLSYICPNEHEANDIVGIKPQDESSINEAVAKLHKMGVENVLITLGKAGCVFSDGNRIVNSPSIDIAPVVDPTAAGDSFIGAFCTAVSSGISADDALVFANCTAGITVSRMGAQTSLPTFDEVICAMKEKGYNTEKFNMLMN